MAPMERGDPVGVPLAVKMMFQRYKGLKMVMAYQNRNS